ncbi:GRAS family transcription factor [Zostera marina]|uniref:GRAS family transcription factor n=1 Tax=Zostera marina TaxID=29655 RepID=A0A0K9PQJ0_ZOSMR|nr:GRAS family transcription factor [Zostera marina]
MNQVQFHATQPFQSLNDASSNDDSQLGIIPEQYSTPDSLGASGYLINSSPSTIGFTSTDGSPLSQEIMLENYGSPAGGFCVSEDTSHLKNKIRELEIAMLGPEEFTGTNSLYSELNVPKVIDYGDLKQTLIACAKAIANDDMMITEMLLKQLEKMVSVSGDPLKRLGAYVYEGLLAKLASSGSSIYKALRCKEPISTDLLSYMHILFDVCPYFKFGYMSANGAIAEALRGENSVHIIDFQIAMGSQWVTLIRALAQQPGGPPHLRITGIDDPVSKYARGGDLNLVGEKLASLAESCNVPFEFHPVPVFGWEVKIEHLEIRHGEALAINFAFQLHHMPDESVNTWNHRDRIIRMAKSLSPRVVTLVEQESNTNTASFYSRFLETIDFYTAMFETIDATQLTRDNVERIHAEQHCVARDIVNIIACEGVERVERHELLTKWKTRFTMAGFKMVPLSPFVNSKIKLLLENYNENFRLVEDDGALYLGWKNRKMVSSCAWR